VASHVEFVSRVEELLRYAEEKAARGATFETALGECLKKCGLGYF